MIRHSNPPGQPLTALYLLHVGSMDARLIGLSTERHWKHQVKLASALNEAEVVLVDCDRPGIEAAVEQLASRPRTGVVYYAFHPKDHAQRFPNRLILGKPLNLEALPAILAKAAADAAHVIAAPPPRFVAPPAAAARRPGRKNPGLPRAWPADRGRARPLRRHGRHPRHARPAAPRQALLQP
jgi:hypothetical protein